MATGKSLGYVACIRRCARRRLGRVRVSEIFTYPVKGCPRVAHDEAVVEPWGLAGDRRWLVTDPGGVAITQRDVPTLALLRARPGPEGLALSYPDTDPLVIPPLRPDPTAKATVWRSMVAAMPAARGRCVAHRRSPEARLRGWSTARRAVEPTMRALWIAISPTGTRCR